MSGKTEINPAVNAAPGALLPALPAGTVIAGKYEVMKPLSISTGEADLYICRYDGEEYVAKLYRRQRAVKQEVLAALRSIDSPYVASLYDMGEYGGRPFEILPYYQNGSLQGRKFTLKELKETIIPEINEALRVLHQNDIIHKDLKPSNIMLRDDNKSIAIIDFGISSVVEEGNTVLVTKTGMTPEYSAPETFRNLFLEESDYYSFGITVYELFCGCTPYKNMNAEEVARFTAVQRLPFPGDMPEELQELISAVTYFDITNRNKKENPNRRWTYEEVARWCKGEKQAIPGEGEGAAGGWAISEYSFMGRKYKDIPSLIKAFADDWEEGKKQLYRGLMSAFFKNFNPEIAGCCMDAEEAATRNAEDDDVIFWNLLYRIYPGLNGFCWRGQSYESLAALGCDMLERLWRRDKSNYAYWDSILKNRLLSAYLKRSGTENEEQAAAVAALESAHALEEKEKPDRNVMINYYLTAYLLSGRRIFRAGERQFENVTELVVYMKELAESSYEAFEDFCRRMLNGRDVLDVQLEAWLTALGKRGELEDWRLQLD